MVAVVCLLHLQPLTTTATTQGQAVADAAMAQLGKPYQWGGSSPKSGFDCAGLVVWTFQEAGLSVPPRYLPQMMMAGSPVDAAELMSGDLVFFAHTYKSGLSHVGIATSPNTFVHAANESLGVIESRLDNPYWHSHFAGAVRVRE